MYSIVSRGSSRFVPLFLTTAPLTTEDRDKNGFLWQMTTNMYRDSLLKAYNTYAYLFKITTFGTWYRYWNFPLFAYEIVPRFGLLNLLSYYKQKLPLHPKIHRVSNICWIVLLLAAQLQVDYQYLYKPTEIIFDWVRLLSLHLLWKTVIGDYGSRPATYIIFHLLVYVLVTNFALKYEPVYGQAFPYNIDIGTTELDLVHSYLYETIVLIISIISLLFVFAIT